MTALPGLLLVVPSALFGMFAEAQGTIRGSVSSPAGQPLSGVSVLLTEDASGSSERVVSDLKGRFTVRGLDPGTYTIVATLPGYEEELVRGIRVRAGEVTELDLALRLPGFSESVFIRAPAGDDETPGAPVEELAIEELDLLPLATDRFQEAFSLLPGVVRDPEGRLSFNGARPSQSILLVNGTNVTDPVTGDFAVELPLRAIEAVEVRELPYSAEFGRVTAAVAEVKTRGGSDEWDLETGDLLPKPNFRDGKIRGIRSFVPQIGVSGPIEKGKLWFSQGLAYRFVRTRTYDSPEGDDERDLEGFDTFTQLDWRVSEDHHLTTTFSYFPLEVDNLGLDALTTADATPEFHSWGWNAAVSARSMFSRALLETSVAVKRYDLSLRPKAQEPSRLTPDGLRQNYFHRIERRSDRVDLSASVTRAIPAGAGEHVLKLGGSLTRALFEGAEEGLPLEVVDASGRLLRRVDFLGDPRMEGDDLLLAGFLQDRWRVTDRLGLEAGLRYDFDHLVGEHQLAPRFAAAYALDASGETVARAGFGIFYDHVFLHVDGFENFQTRVETSFGPEGEPIGDPVPFHPRVAEGGLETPRSTTWNLGLDRKLAEWLDLRVSYRERHGSKEMIVDRILEGGEGTLLLSSRGESRNRELGVTLRVATEDEDELFVSYSKSRSTGDLNHFGSVYQNLRSPLIHENQESLLDLDVPHRFLMWGLWKLPWDLQLAPGVEWRSGFPYTVFDEAYSPVGERNRGGRFPTFLSFDLRLTRGLTVKGRRIRVGVQVFNLGSHVNPREVVSNLGSPRFGQFLNSVDMGISFRLTLGE